MSTQAFGSAVLFPELQLTRVCQVVGGTAIADKAVGKLVLGRNHGGVGDTTAAYTAAALDGIAVGDQFPNFITAATFDDYPTTAGNATTTTNWVWPILGINASGASIADDGKGKFVFRGNVVATLTLTTATDDFVPGAFVFYDVSADVLKLANAIGNVDRPDLIVGRTLAYVTNTTASTVDCPIFFDGIGSQYAIIDAA